MDKQEKLNELKKRMADDTALPLRKGATNLVFGEGSSETEIMFIGEGPGYYEDQKGRPFVGNAGAFLNQLLTTAGLIREKVFITNVVHHRPPQNRDPEPDEIKAYGLYLDQMIDIISPKIIVTLGRFSMGKFLVNWEGDVLVIVPMYHPAAGLRNPSVKEQTVEDFKKLPGILEGVKNKESSKKEKVEQMQLV